MEPFNNLSFWLLSIFAYLSGSVPWGLVIVRIFSGQDVRKLGSKNIGATNVRRIAGLKPGLITLAADMAKGGVPTYLALLLNDKSNISSDLFISLVALSAFLGHLYPCFMKFKDGGKGVATATGCFLIISPFACIISFTVFFITVFLSNRVSAGSLVASAVLPFATWLINGSIILTSCAALIACFIFIRHSGNIKRLISGTEPVFKEKKK